MLAQLKAKAASWYASQSPIAKAGICFYVGSHLIAVVFAWYFTPAVLFDAVAKWAIGLSESSFGAITMILTITLLSIPPLFGYGTAIALCGFAFGTIYGWAVAAIGTVIGATVSFVLVRHMLGIFLPLMTSHPHIRSLSTAVETHGLYLIVLIRLCPFPFSYTNAFFASLRYVSLFEYIIGCIAMTIKLFIHVWIGSRLFLLADADSREQMDPVARRVNMIYIVAGVALAGGVSWYIYRITSQYAHPELESSAFELEAYSDGEQDDDIEAQKQTRNGDEALLDNIDDMLSRENIEHDLDDFDDDNDWGDELEDEPEAKPQHTLPSSSQASGSSAHVPSSEAHASPAPVQHAAFNARGMSLQKQTPKYTDTKSVLAAVRSSEIEGENEDEDDLWGDNLSD